MLHFEIEITYLVWPEIWDFLVTTKQQWQILFSPFGDLLCFVFWPCNCNKDCQLFPLVRLGEDTGQPRYVNLAYLEYTAYVEVIIHSQALPLCCFVFQTCLCRTWLSQNLGYMEVVFHFRKLVFRFFATTCVEVNFVLVKKSKQFDCQTK